MRLIDVDLKEVDETTRLRIEDIRRRSHYVGFLHVEGDSRPISGEAHTVRVTVECWRDEDDLIVVLHRVFVGLDDRLRTLVKRQLRTEPQLMLADMASVLPPGLKQLLGCYVTDDVDSAGIEAMAMLNRSPSVSVAWEVGEKIRDIFNHHVQGADILRAAMEQQFEGLEASND